MRLAIAIIFSSESLKPGIIVVLTNIEISGKRLHNFSKFSNIFVFSTTVNSLYLAASMHFMSKKIGV